MRSASRWPQLSAPISYCRCARVRARSSVWPKSSRRERSRSIPRSRFATATAICSRPDWSGPECRRRWARWCRRTSRLMCASLPGWICQRAADRAEVESILADFARRGIRFAYLQQEVVGRVVKFYGVSGVSYFTIQPEDEKVAEAAVRALSEAALAAAAALGLGAWGGDAVLSGDRFAIIDFNDWPSYSRVRQPAARAIARRAMSLLGRSR